MFPAFLMMQIVLLFHDNVDSSRNMANSSGSSDRRDRQGPEAVGGSSFSDQAEPKYQTTAA